MASIPLPALSVQPPPQQDPLAGIKQALAIKGAQQSQVLQQQQIQGAQQENQQRALQLQDQQVSRKAMLDSNGDPDTYLANLRKGGVSGQTYFQSAQSLTELKQKAATLTKDQQDIADKNNDWLTGQLETIRKAADPQQRQAIYQNALQGAQRRGIDISKYPPTAPASNDDLDVYETQLKLGSQIRKEALQSAEQQRDVSQGQKAAVEAQQGAKVLAGTGTTGITAAQQAAIDQKKQEIGVQRGELSVAQGRLGEEKRHNKVAEGGTATDIPAGVTGQDALKLMDPARAAAVQQVGDGRVDLGMMLSRMLPGAKEGFLKDVESYKPGYSQQTYGITKDVAKNATSGPLSQQLMAISTAREHMKTFRSLAEALDNGDVTALNKVGNALGIQFGSDKATNFHIAAQAFGGEVGKAFDGAGVVAGERAEAQKNFNAAMSKGQFKGAIDTVDELLAGKQTAAKKSYSMGMQGKPNFGEESGSQGKTLTSSAIQQAAKDHGVSVEEATRQAKAAGYSITQ